MSSPAPKLKARSFDHGLSLRGIPEVTAVRYEGTLRISLLFAEQNSSLVVEFERVRGFRLLDEGDLLEFWSERQPDGWLWQIDEGGWRDLEKQRSGFVTQDAATEYLIAGQNDCVSVLAHGSPKLIR